MSWSNHPEFCMTCPICGTQYCHELNPKAPAYTRSEKIKIREALDAGKIPEVK